LVLLLYLLAAAFVTLFVVLTIHFFWTSNIRDKALRIFALVTISFIVYGVVIVVPFLVIIPDFDDAPVVHQEINSDYYFTQKTYGWVTNLGGKELYFYQNRPYWFDKKLGRVDVSEQTGEFDASVISLSDTSIILTIKTNQVLVLDTVLTIRRNFDVRIPN
jgi:hypothetical protein